MGIRWANAQTAASVVGMTASAKMSGIRKARVAKTKTRMASAIGMAI
jgi:hypothetical protein